jgi:beta-glucosidase
MTSRQMSDQATALGDDEAVTEIMIEKRVVDALAELDLPARVRLLTGASLWRTKPAPEVGLAAMVLSDGPAGVRGERADEREPSASLPCPSALAATWDERLLGRVGRLVAAQARAKGVQVVLGPTVNLHRSPLGGRHFECLAEDPLLTARVGGALVRGIQEAGVAATAKHYVANESETERFTVDVQVAERALREVYLAPFESLVVEAGAWVVMAAYNSVAGATMTENPLLRDPLKDLWGFDGVVVSDWFATRSVVPAARSGLDLVMPGPFGPWGQDLVAAVRSGEVAAEIVEDKVRRLLRLAARVGALTEPATAAVGATALMSGATSSGEPAGRAARAPADDGADPAGPRARAVLREAAAAGMVLLRNEGGLLPLADLASPPASGAPARRVARLAVIGPNATRPRGQGGGSATVLPPHLVDPAAGLRAALGDAVEVVTATGVRAEPWPDALTARNAVDPVSGEPGVRLRFFDEDGGEVRSERRLTGRLLFIEDPELGRSERVEVAARIRARSTGRHAVGIAGVGEFELRVLVDGAETVLFDGCIDPPDGNLVAGFLRPPVWWDGVELAAGQEALITMRHTLPAGLPLASFGLLAEEPWLPADEELEAAVTLAAGADAAIVVVGTSERAESEGVDRAALALADGQDELVRRVAAANPRTVVVVNAGAPVLLPWRDEVPAVLLSWFPGQEFGGALADVLLGHAEPGGRLPTTWPAEERDCPVLSVTPTDGVLDYGEGLHIGYRGWARRGAPAPAYPFGHGLGYTTWSYESLAAPAAVPAGRAAQVHVTVRNTGARRGRAVVQAYLSRAESVVERPALWLAGFAVVDAAPGQSVTVPVDLAARSFEHWRPASAGAEGGWAAEAGAFELRVGPSSVALPLHATLRLDDR